MSSAKATNGEGKVCRHIIRTFGTQISPIFHPSSGRRYARQTVRDLYSYPIRTLFDRVYTTSLYCPIAQYTFCFTDVDVRFMCNSLRTQHPRTYPHCHHTMLWPWPCEGKACASFSTQDPFVRSRYRPPPRLASSRHLEWSRLLRSSQSVRLLRYWASRRSSSSCAASGSSLTAQRHTWGK